MAKCNEAKKEVIKISIIRTGFLAIIAMGFVFISIYNLISNPIFILSITFVMTIVIFVVTLLFSFRKYQKHYSSYELIIDDDNIRVKSDTESKKISISKIKKITKDDLGNIRIYENNVSTIFVSKYIDNKEEFENKLNQICKIENANKSFSFIFQWITIIPLVGLLLVSRLHLNYKLYLIFAILFLITTVYSLVSIIFSQTKKTISTFIVIIVNLYLVYLVSRGFYTVIKALVQGYL
jgi:hypothetical protein